MKDYIIQNRDGSYAASRADGDTVERPDRALGFVTIYAARAAANSYLRTVVTDPMILERTITLRECQ